MTRHISDIAKACLCNEAFIDYVFDRNPESSRYWHELMDKCPELKSGILEAENILLHLEDLDCAFSDEEIENLRVRIAKTMKKGLNW